MGKHGNNKPIKIDDTTPSNKLILKSESSSLENQNRKEKQGNFQNKNPNALQNFGPYKLKTQKQR